MFLEVLEILAVKETYLKPSLKIWKVCNCTNIGRENNNEFIVIFYSFGEKLLHNVYFWLSVL